MTAFGRASAIRLALVASAMAGADATFASTTGELAASFCSSTLEDRGQIKAALVARGDAAARALVDVLRSDRHACWEQSADALIAIGPGAAAVVPDLLAILRDARAAEHAATPGEKSAAAYSRGIYAAIAAAGIRPGEPALTAELGDMLERGSPSSKAIAARLLAGGKSSDAAVRISRALADPSPMVREEAANALGRMGAAADPAVPALLAAAERDRAQYLAQASIAALRKIDTPRARDALKKLNAQ